MVTRSVLLVDRALTLLLAGVLMAGGVLGAWWWSGSSDLPDTVDASSLRSVVHESWWPVASAGAGVVLVLLGGRWILAHLVRSTVSRLHLRGSSVEGRLDVAGSKVAGAAADAFSDTVGVRSARGSVVRDRGQLVARLSAVIEPDCDLRRVAAQADAVSAQLRQVLDRDDVRCSVELRVATFGTKLPRVH